VLNALQTGLSMLGFVPGFGAIADVVNAGISAARGDYIGAGFSLAAAVPFIGDFAAAGKAIRSVTQVSRVSHSAAPVMSAARVERAVANTAGLETRGLRPAPGTRVRPDGVPDNWKATPTETGGGVQFTNSANTNQNVRIMQGNPGSQYPNSQAAYVRQQNAGGTYLRQDGTPSPLPKGGRNDGDAHIPLDQFIFRP
jgi:hypothetical protein